uniref:Ankyrin-2 n=1 Tax=Cacopsylla melanoneura TaxID=428564 RepID=A0A8D8Q1Z5_9HEMI
MEGATSLMYAAQQGKDAEVKAILASRPNAVRERDRTRKTVLHYCAENTSLSCAEAILEVAPDLIEAADEDGYTPLHLAAIAGNVPLIHTLLAHRANVNSQDNEGHSVVHWATVCGEVEALETVLSAGAEPSTPDIHGGYPIHYASQMCGHASEMGLAVLKVLLHHNVDVNVVDKDGRQPILWAASAGSSDAILALVKAGANVEAHDKDGLTALHCAASRGHRECLETLITLCGADVDVIDTNGCSALFYAVTLGHADATTLLLQYGATPNRQDRKGRTPAHCGAAKGQFETLRILHEQGANVWARNVKGDFPLHDAVQSGRRELVIWLLTQRPDAINATNNDGKTPLHIAAIYNNVEMGKLLLDQNCLVNPVMRTSKGQLMTPLDASLYKNNRGCAKFLQLHGGVPANRLTSETAALRATSKIEINPDQYIDNLNVSVSERISRSPLTVPLVERTTINNLTAVRSPLPSENKTIQVDINDEISIEGRKSKQEIARLKKKKHGKKKRKFITSSSEEDEEESEEWSSYDGGKMAKKDRRKQKNKFEQQSSEEYLNKTEITVNLNNKKCVKIKDCNALSSRANQCNQLCCQGKSEVIVEEVKRKNDKCICNETQVKHIVHKDDDDEDEGRQGGRESGKSSRREKREEQRSGNQGDNERSNKQRGEGKSDNRKQRSDKVKTEDKEDVSKIETNQETVETTKTTVIKQEVEETTFKKQELYNKDMAKKIHEELVQKEIVKVDVHEEADRKPENEEVKIEAEKMKSEKQEITPEAKKIEPSDDKAVVKEVEATAKLLVDATTHLVDATEKGSNIESTTPEQKVEVPQIEIHEPSVTSETDVSQSEEIKVSDKVQSESAAEETVSNISEGKVGDVESPNVTKNENVTRNKKESVGDENKPDDTANIQETKEITKTKMEKTLNEKTTEQNGKKETDKKEQKTEATKTKESDNKTKDKKAKGSEKETTVDKKEIQRKDQKDGKTRDKRGAKPKDNNGADDVEDIEKFIEMEKEMESQQRNNQKSNEKTSPDKEKTSLDKDKTKSQKDKQPKSKKTPKESDSEKENDKGLLAVLEDNENDYDQYENRGRRTRPKSAVGRRGQNTQSKVDSRRSKSSFQILTDDSGKGDDNTNESTFQRGSRREMYGSKTDDEDMNQYNKSKSRKGDKRNTSKSDYEYDDDGPYDINTMSVTQAVQQSMRKYHLERRIFHELLELKRLQIRAGKSNEQILVKRLVDEYKKAGLIVGLKHYDGIYTFKHFERYLYDQLRLLQQSSSRKLIPRIKSSDDYDKLTAELKRTKAGKTVLENIHVPENPFHCTHSTYRCYHATHAYTGIPCAAYIAKIDHHTLPKPGMDIIPGTFLPRIEHATPHAPDQEITKCLRHVDPNRPVTLELSHGGEKQIISLPTQNLNKNKKYFVTFTIKGNDETEGKTGSGGGSSKKQARSF